MMVLATNRPGDLDSAVTDRVDETVEFGLPALAERERLVEQYFGHHLLSFTSPACRDQFLAARRGAPRRADAALASPVPIKKRPAGAAAGGRKAAKAAAKSGGNNQ